MAEIGKTEGPAAREMLTFLIGAQEFCIDVMSVREIRVWTPATPVAHAPSFVCGVINLRGNVLPIIDFAARLGFPPAKPTTRHAILVVQIRDQTIGLLVEGVTEILTVSRISSSRRPRSHRKWRGTSSAASSPPKGE